MQCTSLIVALLAMLLTGLSQAAAAADRETPKPAVLAVAREQLSKQLQQRNRQLKPAQVELKLYGAADEVDLDLTLRRGGGEWLEAFAEVLGWEQSTMQEWRGWHLANGTRGVWRPTMRHAANPAGLKLDGAQLSGTVDLELKADRSRDEQLPPEEPISWWDRFIPVGHMIPRKQRCTIEAKVYDDVHLVELVLVGGVHWDPASTGREAGPVVRRLADLRAGAGGGGPGLAHLRSHTDVQRRLS